MTHWQTGDLQANGLKLHYTRTGGQKRPLMLVHGFSDDGLCWSPMAEALESEFDVIMLDARGHGFSDAPENGYNPPDLAADLRAAIAAFGLNKPAILGHSMGAISTLALAGMYPDVPSAILLEDPPAWWIPFPPLPSDAPEIEARLRASFAQRKGQTREQLIEEQRQASPTWPDAELGPWADSKLRFNLEAIEAIHPRVGASLDWKTVLRQVVCPVLLIRADTALGAIITPELESTLRELIPQLESVHIAEAGHSIHREQPAIFLDRVRDFLAAHE